MFLKGDAVRIPHQGATADSAYWFSRLFVAVSVLITGLVPLLDQRSISHQLLVESGWMGVVGSWVLVVLAGVIVLDVVINDLMPARFRLVSTKKHRAMLFMGLALGEASLLFISVKGGDLTILHLRFLWQIVGAALLAWLDMFARCRQ